MGDKVLTANRLTDGIAVWLDANGKWSTALQEALVARHAEAVAALEAIGKNPMPTTRSLTSPSSTFRKPTAFSGRFAFASASAHKARPWNMPRATLLPIPNSLQSEEDDVPLRRI